MKRNANARWQGSASDGSGALTVESGTLKDTPYSFKSRFGDGRGTNPEELLAAAHAGCFTMALSLALINRGCHPEMIETKARLTMDQSNASWIITSIHLETHARVPGLDDATFARVAEETKVSCPISKVLNATVTLDAALLV